MTAYKPNDSFTANDTYEFAAKQLNKELGVEVKNFLQKLTPIRDGPVKKCRETRNRRKHKKTILLQKGRGKERLEDYSTSVA